jgi:hypothetical protein
LPWRALGRPRRSYHPTGLLATDTLRLRNYASGAFGHDSELR